MGPVSDTQWGEIHQKLMAAGLIPARSVKDTLLSMPSIDPVIQAAKAAGSKGMLDEEMLDSLLIEKQEQVAVVARTIAPISEPEPVAPARIHNLDHYRL